MAEPLSKERLEAIRAHWDDAAYRHAIWHVNNMRVSVESCPIEPALATIPDLLSALSQAEERIKELEQELIILQQSAK